MARDERPRAAIIPALCCFPLMLCAAALAAAPVAAQQWSCVEQVPPAVCKLKVRAASESAVSYEWLPPRGDRFHGE
jgi:hypothetical protein